MKRGIGIAIGIGFVVALCGCATTPEPEPTPTASANATACQDLYDEIAAIPGALNGADNGPEIWEDIRANFDRIGLAADGQVATRIDRLVTSWPDTLRFVVWKEFDDFNAGVEDIERACQADGVEIELPKLTT